MLLAVRTAIGLALLIGFGALLASGSSALPAQLMVLLGLFVLFAGAALALPGLQVPLSALVRQVSRRSPRLIAPQIASARELLKPQVSAALLMFALVLFPADLTTFALTARRTPSC